MSRHVGETRGQLCVAILSSTFTWVPGVETPIIRSVWQVPSLTETFYLSLILVLTSTYKVNQMRIFSFIKILLNLSS